MAMAMVLNHGFGLNVKLKQREEERRGDWVSGRLTGCYRTPRGEERKEKV